MICTASQWTGFYMRATLAFNGLKDVSKNFVNFVGKHAMTSFLSQFAGPEINYLLNYI